MWLHVATPSSTSGKTASYDAGGAMTCRAPTSSATCSGTPTGAQLTFDNEGRLSAWQNTPSSPTSSDSFLYDGAGNRVEQQSTTNGAILTSTVYVAGGLEEITSTGASTTLTKYLGAQGLPTAEGVGTNGPLSYLATDGQGTVSETLDGSGSVTSAQLYTPYGNVRYSSGSSPTSLGYTGQRADSATGLDDYHARYYDPVAGQFASADTVADGLNRYGYVAGNPTTATDPSGHRIDPGSFGNDYQAWLQARKVANITKGYFLSPNVRNAAKTGGSKTVQAATALAIRQNNLGGVNAILRSGTKVQTLGTAVVYVDKWNDQTHQYEPMDADPLGFVQSDGSPAPNGHAEGKVIAEILQWIAEFRTQHVDNLGLFDRLKGWVGRYRFTFDMVIAQGPCKECRKPDEFTGWMDRIRSALSFMGGFEFHWDFLASDDREEPRQSDVAPQSSVLKSWRSYAEDWPGPPGGIFYFRP